MELNKESWQEISESTRDNAGKVKERINFAKPFLGLPTDLDFGNSKVLCLQIFETQADPQSDNVRVVVRCRPMNEKEVAGGCSLAVNVEESRGIITVKTTGARSGEPPKQFTYDRVFGVNTKQVDVYNDAARPIVNCVLEGYNGKNDTKSSG